jgi:glycosyltransferase involved in cell wall biosynthesis
MRILIVLHQFYPEFSGGTERVSLNLAKAAQRAGHFVEILACSVNPNTANGFASTHLTGARETVYQGVPLTLLPRTLIPASADFSLDTDLTLSENISGWIREKRFDICHVMHVMRMSTAVLAIQHCGLPFILTLTDFFLACPRINLVDLDNRICEGPELGNKCGKHCLTAPWSRDSLVSRFEHARELLSSASFRVVPSAFVADRYRKAFPTCEFQVIPHGIDLLALTLSQVTISGQARSAKKLRLGYVGGIIPQKGLDVLLRALALVPSQDIELKVIGGFHGASAFHRDVLALGKADSRVEFLGHLDPTRVFEEMQQLDLLCLPSLVPETFSLALHEASALGVPALVSDLGAPGAHVAHHGGGQVLAFGDAAIWAESIRQVIENPDKITTWKARLPLPLRVEEEGFFYDSLYRALPREI